MNAAVTTPPRLALGPILFYWPKEQVPDFYRNIAETPVDIVYLGETVCSKRRQLRLEDWLEIAETLTAAGKEVVLSTLTLVEAESELITLRRICENDRYLVEANDLGAVHLLEGSPFITGPSVNLYNARSLAVLAAAGLKRWVLPVELSRDTLAALQRERPEGLESEVFAFGKLPLAFSARCFTARAHNLPKDDCQYRCLDDPDGLPLATQEGAPFLNLNGIQTQSAQTFNLLPHLDDLKRLGVDVLRISPQSLGTERVIETFRRCLDGEMGIKEGVKGLARLMPQGPCDGYWLGTPGLEARAAEFAAS